MRKDMIASADFSGLAEPDFVERYWTEVWQRQGTIDGAVAKIPTKPEFRVMTPYLDALPKGARIVDGGCGLGDWVVCLKQRGFDVLGIDISRETVAILEERFPDVAFEVGDIRATGLPDTSVDVYFSWGVFEHFEEGLGRCIDEALRILKPGGHLFITVPFDNIRMSLKASFGSPGAYRKARDDERFYQWRLTREELARELSHGGFEVLDVMPMHKRQGMLRSLHHEFGLPYGWLLTRGLAFGLAPVVPGRVVAHMLMAVARRPDEPAG